MTCGCGRAMTHECWHGNLANIAWYMDDSLLPCLDSATPSSSFCLHRRSKNYFDEWTTSSIFPNPDHRWSTISFENFPSTINDRWFLSTFFHPWSMIDDFITLFAIDDWWYLLNFLHQWLIIYFHFPFTLRQNFSNSKNLEFIPKISLDLDIDIQYQSDLSCGVTKLSKLR